MLFLFENTLTHYIYIVPNIHPSHHTTTVRHTSTPLQAVEMGAPSHHEQRTTPSQTATHRHRFTPGRLSHHRHAWYAVPHMPIRTPSPPPTATPRPLQVFEGIYPVKSRLLLDTIQLLRDRKSTRLNSSHS